MTQFNIFSRNQIYIGGIQHKNFQSYYNKHCKTLKEVSIKFFFVGTIALILAGTILWYARLSYLYNSIGVLIIKR